MKLHNTNRNTTRLIQVILGAVGCIAPALSNAVPVDIAGVILSPSQRAQVISTLGVTTILASGTEVIGFDINLAIAELGQSPNVFRIFDDGIPATGPDASGGPFTGVDVDAIGGTNSGGQAVWGTQVTFVEFGPEITPASNTLGEFHDPSVDGLFGDSAAEGFPANVLGPADAPVSFSTDINDFINFTSIGSGGILEMAFSGRIADANVVDNFDLFLFEVGAAGDNAFFQVDVAVIPIPPAFWLFGSGILGLIGMARRRSA